MSNEFVQNENHIYYGGLKTEFVLNNSMDVKMTTEGGTKVTQRTPVSAIC